MGCTPCLLASDFRSLSGLLIQPHSLAEWPPRPWLVPTGSADTQLWGALSQGLISSASEAEEGRLVCVLTSAVMSAESCPGAVLFPAGLSVQPPS